MLLIELLLSEDWWKGSVGWVMDRGGGNCGVFRPLPLLSVDWWKGSVGWVMDRGGGNCGVFWPLLSDWVMDRGGGNCGGPRGEMELAVLRLSLSGGCWKEDCEGWVMDRGG